MAVVSETFCYTFKTVSGAGKFCIKYREKRYISILIYGRIYVHNRLLFVMRVQL